MNAVNAMDAVNARNALVAMDPVNAMNAMDAVNAVNAECMANIGQTTTQKRRGRHTHLSNVSMLLLTR